MSLAFQALKQDMLSLLDKLETKEKGLEELQSSPETHNKIEIENQLEELRQEISKLDEAYDILES